MSQTRNILDRLEAGPVVGDGGAVFCLEQNCLLTAGPWVPDAVVTNPDAVRELHRSFLRAGAEVIQTCNFYCSEDKLGNRGYDADEIGVDRINDEACKLAREVADEGNALVAAGLSQTPTYLSTRDEDLTKEEFRKQCVIFNRNKHLVDFVVVEYFEHVEEAVWAVEVCKENLDMPVAATISIGPSGDLDGVSPGDCAVRLARAGADIVGVNCHFDPPTCLKTMKKMKAGLEKSSLSPYLMCQPLAYWTQDCDERGFIGLDDFPFSLESRRCTRWDIQDYAQKAEKMGIHLIGGCCGFQPYHVRAVAEGLGRPVSRHLPWGGGLRMHTKPFVRKRANKKHWKSTCPSTGRDPPDTQTRKKRKTGDS